MKTAPIALPIPKPFEVREWYGSEVNMGRGVPRARSLENSPRKEVEEKPPKHRFPDLMGWWVVFKGCVVFLLKSRKLGKYRESKCYLGTSTNSLRFLDLCKAQQKAQNVTKSSVQINFEGMDLKQLNCLKYQIMLCFR